ncbi:L-rhamnose-binding lectin SML-like [Salarias fasciatus]|nr:L-rhamnose-binding lectin SML-like [Salarias fasciatus]XP_029974405.1 L-rhamnose-binding lectin SML-like [Salarias fasciatus]XP_029974408.1 L-rhamnose-binding lectin SML-like [Salarias fasciatus]
MLCFRPCTALLLATACLFLSPAVSAERATSCDSGNSVHRLSCDIGVISVQESLYGREDRVTCSEGKHYYQLANTECSLAGTTELIRRRCDGKKVCELITASDIRILDPCPGILKYVDTNYTCLPALTHVACQQSLARLHCDQGQVIVVYGADYGRRDRTTCINGRPDSQLQNVSCSKPTNIVATRCNGKNTCDIRALNSVFGDPCPDIYKYLEVAYRCKYPSVTDS